MIKNTRLIGIDKFFSICVIFLPFLYQYRGIVSVISLGETLLLPFIVYYFFTDIKILACQKSLLGLYFCAIASTLIASFAEYFILEDAMSLMMRLVFYALLILTGRHHFSYSCVQKIYRVFVVAVAVYLLLQYLYHMVSGGYLPVYIKYEWLFAPERRAPTLEEEYRWFFRPSGVFLEPSYYALFSLPALVDMAIGKKKDYVSFAIVSVAFIASMAMSGIAGITIIVLFLCVKMFREKGNKKYIFIFILATAVSVAMISGMLSGVIDRLESGGSFNERITQGIISYVQLPFVNKIFGVGLNNLGHYISYYGLATGYSQENLNYCCTILQCLNFSGIFALIALIAVLKKFWGGSRNTLCKCLVAILIFIMCYESILYSYRFAFYLLLVYSWQKELQSDIVIEKKIKELGV